MLLEPGDVLMGEIDYLVWEVVKSFVHSDNKNIGFTEEMNVLNTYFEKNKNTWQDITENFMIQFPELN